MARKTTTYKPNETYKMLVDVVKANDEIMNSGGNPISVSLIGERGIGKTTFASTMNNPIIVQCEDGIGKIECNHTKVQKTYIGFEEYLLALLNDSHEFKTVVVDSLDWLFTNNLWLCIS